MKISCLQRLDDGRAELMAKLKAPVKGWFSYET